MTLIIRDVNSNIAAEEGMAGRYVLATVIAVGLWLPQLAAGAPRDAVALLPELRHETFYEAQSLNKQGELVSGYEELRSEWAVYFRPPITKLKDGEVSWKADFVTKLRDRTEHPFRGTNDGREDYYTAEATLHSGPLRVGHRLERRDTTTGTETTQDLSTFQLNLTSFSLALPASSRLEINSRETRNYGGPPNVVARGSEGSSLVSTFSYQPVKAELEQELRVRTTRETTSNPLPGTRTAMDESVVEALRTFEVGGIGSLKWQARHMERTNNSAIAVPGQGSTTQEDQQLVSLTGRTGQLPVDYSIDLLHGVNDYGRESRAETSKAGVRIALQGRNNPYFRSLLFLTKFEQTTTTDPIPQDNSLTTNQVTWTLAPHERISSVLAISRVSRVERALGAADETKYNASTTYAIPGNAGKVLLSAWQNTESRFADRNYSEGYLLQNQVELSRNASLVLEYKQQMDATGQLGASAAPNSFDSAGVAYVLHASPDLTFRGEWYQDLTTRERNFVREDIDRSRFELLYSPDPWTYQLIVDGRTEDLDSASATSTYADTTTITARVTVSF